VQKEDPKKWERSRDELYAFEGVYYYVPKNMRGHTKWWRKIFFKNWCTAHKNNLLLPLFS